jgi:hypothetical protein
VHIEAWIRKEHILHFVSHDVCEVHNVSSCQLQATGVFLQACEAKVRDDGYKFKNFLQSTSCERLETIDINYKALAQLEIAHVTFRFSLSRRLPGPWQAVSNGRFEHGLSFDAEQQSQA